LPILQNSAPRIRFSVLEFTALMSVFDQRKTRILQELESDVPDLSPKGRPDEQIIELLELLNAHQDYVTTSSCSGRAVVYLDADRDGHDEDARGRWLMNEHSSLQGHFSELSSDIIYQTFFGDHKVGDVWNANDPPSRLVTFKFEPLVCELDLYFDIDCPHIMQRPSGRLSTTPYSNKLWIS